LRWGEATGLRVRDVDLDRRRVSVRENAVAVGGKIIVGTPKTHKVRSVPFPRFLAAELKPLVNGRAREEIPSVVVSTTSAPPTPATAGSPARARSREPQIHRFPNTSRCMTSVTRPRPSRSVPERTSKPSSECSVTPQQR
jgi:integrase